MAHQSSMRIIQALAFGALGLLVTSGEVEAQFGGRIMERTVSVSASGSVMAEPDQALISTGVQTEGDTARDALSRNNAAMSKLIEGLKALAIDAKDIQTAGLNVNPRYSNPRDGRPPAINGYQANNQVRILVRDLKRLGEILDQSITLGANQMGGIGFDVSKAETLKDEARKVAVANALRRATLYATAAGARVGPVITISEDVRLSGPRPLSVGRAAMAAEAVPVEAGSQKLEVQVHITYALR